MLGQRREREARLMTGDAVAASIAHEVRQPLTAMVTTADAGLRYLDRSLPNLDKAKEAFNESPRMAIARELVGDIRANFKSDVRDRTRSTSMSSSRKRLPWRAAICRGTDRGPGRAEGRCRKSRETEVSCSRCYST